MDANNQSPSFTWSYLEAELRRTLELGYGFIRCRDYVERKQALGERKIVVARVDVDFSIKKLDRMLSIFGALGIRASVFLRLHAKEYNPFSFENYRILRRLLDEGHELGYHSEVVDQERIWRESADHCLRRDLDIMRAYFRTEVVGAASHGGMTGWNNLDFWSHHRPGDFGLLYEGYDKEPAFGLFHDSLYVSDSEWTRWKCYENGVLRPGDRRSLSEHAADVHRKLYMTIHADTYFDRHFYEDE